MVKKRLFKSYENSFIGVVRIHDGAGEVLKAVVDGIFCEFRGEEGYEVESLLYEARRDESMPVFLRQ